ncbi:MAG: TlpA disulfide reductase family protein [Actinomycetota bacterium]|nr:TlpA disulfide reductase family protein [Actinomycetota bacterium]
MLKRNFILLVLFLLISAVYVNYRPQNIVEDISININNGIDLSIIENNNEVDIKFTNEEYIIVNLWASWCTPCIEEVEHLKELTDTGQFYILGLLVDDSENNGKDFIENYKLNYNNVLKEENVAMIVTKFSWNGIPTTLLLDRNFIVIKSFSGPITFDLITSYTN